eukprot:c24276_g2_i1 orf=30-1277(+)
MSHAFTGQVHEHGRFLNSVETLALPHESCHSQKEVKRSCQRVQMAETVSKPNPKIDGSFVVPLQHRPSPRPFESPLGFEDKIPVIDLALLQQDSPVDKAALKTLIAEVGRACQDWGFFQVINHGIPLMLIQNLKEGAKAFFELPLEQKLHVKRTFENVLGYNDGELTKNVRDWKEVFDIGAAGCVELPADILGDDHHTHITLNQWPSSMPHLREVCEAYISAAKKLASTVLHLITQSLGLPPNHFDEQFLPSRTSRLRLNHYPVCPAPELALGVSRHKDVGALTVLLQDDVGGLEVKRKDGEWIRVKPDPTALVINVGDLIQVYSNDKYESVEHRAVVNEKADRYSFPFSFNPAHWVNVSPISELTNERNPARYRPINWGKYMKSRRDSNFKHLGVENLQIYHYAINTQKEVTQT